MSGKEQDGKPRQKLRPNLSANPPARAKSPSATLSDSDFEDTTSSGRTFTGSMAMPPARSAPPKPAAGPKPGTKPPAAAAPPVDKSRPPVASGVLTALPTRFARQLHTSGFDDDERTDVSAVIGNVASMTLDHDEEVVTGTTPLFDGITPAKGVTAPETWKAVMAPNTSHPGRRHKVVLQNCIEQFACGHNPRYKPDPTTQASRMHVFVWDVSRAMGCEMPHFASGRELSLAATVDWLRFEGHNRGWRKASMEHAVEYAEQGLLVLTIPRDPKRKAMAVVRPGGGDERGFPKVACTHPKVGNAMAPSDALFTHQFDFYVHD